MNRDKALTIADRVMTRIETDKAIHKNAIADEIQAGDALDEIVDVISHDGEKWVHRDGTPFDTDADVKQEMVRCHPPRIVTITDGNVITPPVTDDGSKWDCELVIDRRTGVAEATWTKRA